MNNEARVCWIIGASAGIGRALAIELGKDGANVIVSGRHKESLDPVVAQIGPKSRAEVLDVTDNNSLVQVRERILDRFGRIDSAIFMAADYLPMSLKELQLKPTRQIVDVNLMGAFNFIQAVLPLMQKQGKGQVVLCGSVAGYSGLPQSQPYASTKAAIINLAESLYLETRGTGVDIKLINPGFVRTRMTDKNNFDMPALLDPDAAAGYIAKGLVSKHFEIHFPKRFTLFLKMLKVLPYPIYFWLVQRILSN